MRTVIAPSRRHHPDTLVRRRMDALFTPARPQSRHPTPPPDPHPDPAELSTPPPAPPPLPPAPPAELAAPHGDLTLSLLAPALPPLPVAAAPLPTASVGPAARGPDPAEPAPLAPTPPPLPAAAAPLPAPSAVPAARGPDPAEPAPLAPAPGPLPAAGPPAGRGRGRAALVARLPLAWQERLDLDRRAVIGLSVLLVLALGYGVQHFWAGRPEPVAVPVADGSASLGAAALDPGAALGPTSLAPPSAPDPSAGPAPAPGPAPGPAAGPAPGPARPNNLVVDVAGKVRAPGLRTLPPGARVQDALQAAGGPLPGTDLTGLNLARPLGDGEEVVVGVPGPPPLSSSSGSGSGSGPPTTPLSLNSATVQQLDTLPGVGPVLAQRIVQYREQHGGFQSVDQLRHVSGFGERRLQDLRAVLRP